LNSAVPPPEDDGVHDQAKLVDQALVHQTADQRGAADGVHVLAGLLLHVSDLRDVSNDPRVLPADRVQRPGQDDMGRSFREVGVRDLALRSDLAGEGQDAGRVGQDGSPVLFVAGIHPAAEDARIDLGKEIEGILPRVDPIELPMGSLDEAVHRTTSAAMIFLMSGVLVRVRSQAQAPDVRPPSRPIRRVGAGRIGQLLVERLTILETAPEKLRPRRDRR
jgi:hypothetical protein